MVSEKPSLYEANKVIIIIVIIMDRKSIWFD